VSGATAAASLRDANMRAAIGALLVSLVWTALWMPVTDAVESVRIVAAGHVAIVLAAISAMYAAYSARRLVAIDEP
jgi:hypothetical protein